MGLFRQAALARRSIFASLIIGLAANSQAAEWPVSGKLEGKDGKKAEDVSGIACSGALEFPRDCLVIDDETQFAQWARLERGKLVVGENLPLIDDELDGKAVELDGEAAAYGDGSFFVIGSFGSARSANGGEADESAARLKADSHVFRLTPTAEGLSITDSNALRALILADADLRPFADQPLAENGLTVEGLAIVAGTAFVGFRGPVLDSNERAVILELPTTMLFGDQTGLAETRKIRLGTGRGIRDLSPVGDELLVLAGPVVDTDASDAAPGAYRLYRWDPRVEADPLSVFEIPTFTHGSADTPDKPEAVLPLEIADGKLTALILFDGPDEGGPRTFSFDWTH